MFAFLNAPVAGAYHLVSAIAEAIGPVLGELSTAAAIVAFTICVRVLLHPLARLGARGDKARAELAPQLRKLREKHGNDRERLAREVAELQAESGKSLFAGCLPMLLQVPFFMVMYRLFVSPEIGGQANELLGHRLFGAPLGGHFFGTGMPELGVYFGLFAALAVVAWFSVRLQARLAEASESSALPGMRLLRLVPYGTVLAAAVLPLAAGLYLLTTTTWTVLERAALRRPGAPGGADRGKVIRGGSTGRRT